MWLCANNGPSRRRVSPSLRKREGKGKGMVGAAGFEPTTCSTQNCRATRLRYTPFDLGRDVDTRLEHDPEKWKPVFRKAHAQQESQHCRQGGSQPPQWPLNSGWPTRSPGSMPYFFAVPAITSSTPFASPPDGMILVDSGSVFSAIRRIRPSARMKIMSSEM